MVDVTAMLHDEWVKLSTQFHRRAQVYKALVVAVSLADSLVACTSEQALFHAASEERQPNGMITWSFDIVELLRDLVPWTASAISLKSAVIQFHASYMACSRETGRLMVQAGMSAQRGCVSFRKWSLVAVDIHAELQVQLTHAREVYRETRGAYRILQPIMAFQQQVGEQAYSDAELSE